MNERFYDSGSPLVAKLNGDNYQITVATGQKNM